MKKKLDGFEQRELATQQGYWKDARWDLVIKLRKEGNYARANGLVMEIRDDYGVD